MNHSDYATQIGPSAATHNGQNWATLPQHAQQIILDTIRSLDRNPQKQQTALEKNCGLAVEEWYAKQQTPEGDHYQGPPVEAAPVEIPNHPIPPEAFAALDEVDEEQPKTVAKTPKTKKGE